MCVVFFLGIGSWVGEGRGRDLVCFNSGYHGYWGYYTWIIISFLCTRVKVGFFSYAKDMLNSVAFSPRANHTDRAAAAGRRS